MKSLLLIAAAWLLYQPLLSQSTDSVDNLVLNVPASWTITKHETFTELKSSDKQIKSFCQLVVYGQQPSSGNREKDFEQEWKELVEKNFTVLTFVKPVSMKDKKGNAFLRYGAKGIGSDGKKYFIQLNMYACGDYHQSVIAVSGTKEQLSKYDSLWQPLIVQVKKQSATTVDNSNAVQVPEMKTIAGKWAKSASGPPQYQNGTLVNLGSAGYHKCQYEFRTDGTYAFHGESQFSSNDYAITEEKGKYTIRGNQLTITPVSGSIRKVDANGTKKKTDQLPLVKREYNWQLHYFEGINETNLVLSAVNENLLDGGYAGNSLFPNSFLYSREFVPEWRFK